MFFRTKFYRFNGGISYQLKVDKKIFTCNFLSLLIESTSSFCKFMVKNAARGQECKVDIKN